MKSFSIIAATDLNSGIGKNGVIPWNERDDMIFFKHTTTYTQDETKLNAVIMGRVTFESMREKPLKDRMNVVVTQREYPDAPPNLLVTKSLNVALESLNRMPNVERIFVIGGQQLYNEAIVHPDCRRIFLNKIDVNCECDTFFPLIDVQKFGLVSQIVLNERVLACMYSRCKEQTTHRKN